MAQDDDVSIEGSAARAADRGRDQLGFEEDPRPFLGSLRVVQDLLATFCEEVIATRTAYLKDEITPDEAKFKVRQLAAKYGNIIMGRDDKYKADEWHSPRRLGVRIPKVIAPVKGVTDPGEQLFLTLGASLSSISVAYGENRLTDDEAQHHIMTLQSEAAGLILGWENADTE